ncbi:putative WRKY transcription factor 32 [Citrus sinensis]|uniref:WRKY transcription factor 32 n=1 Tax=Citrus sinensis TaxID=2711 RepID=A0ACB8P7S2_CITSI|nr:putative WRKY transcription factor 32 [Citrus sinensis]
MAESESFEARKRHENPQNDEFEEEEEEEDEEILDDEEEDEGARQLTEPHQLQLTENNKHYKGLQVNSGVESNEGTKLKEQVEVSHHEGSGSIAVQAAESQTQYQLQPSICPTSLSELSPTSVTEPISSAPSPTLTGQKLSLVKVDTASVPEANLQTSSELKNVSVVHIVKTPVSDGYNWRKYGQKQVKSPKGSRSYYKCTYSDCCAKKIECSDHSGHVIEIVNKGMHSHDPPRKNNCVRESRLISSVGPVIGNNITEQSLRMLNDSVPSTSSKDSVRDSNLVPERKRPNLSSFAGDGEVSVKEEHPSEPEPKRRVKKDNLANSSPFLKPGKKPKFVVHAAGDVGISGDGYRWRKYGQKMVKGNPNPRCTSAGCPVRKHIETAVDNTSAVIITYKGVHDHDMPVPKKRHGPPSAPLVAAAAPASMNNLQLKKTDAVQNQTTSTQWSVRTEGELAGAAMDLGGEKAMESARTLLSIGFEIKPC